MTEWDGLEEVVAVADAGTFKGAAKHLRVSTSHVSKAIARLEGRLQIQLFNRTTRRVELTSTGHSFVEHSRQIIRERDELLESISGSGEPQGELRITCSISLGERFLAPLVREFMIGHPRLSVTLDFNNRLVDLIAEGYDLAVRTVQISDPRLVGREIASRPLVTVASPTYLAANGEPRSPAELQGHECLIGSSHTWSFLEKGGHPRTFTPRGRWRCNSGHAVVEAAIAGAGICQLPMFYVRRALAENLLVPILDHLRPPPEPIWLAYPQRRHLRSGVSKLAELLQDRLQHAIDAAGDQTSRPAVVAE